MAEHFGKYELEKRLGVGGMAEVWLARQEGPAGFSKRAVIKRILPSLVNDPDFVQMFLREARLAALLNHPNVVQIFDLGEAEHTYFLVMEYIEGRSLRYLQKQTLALGKPCEVGFIASVLAGASAGLHHAHEQRDPSGEPLALVHRDVSPDNLLVSYEGVTKVIDFGIAKAFSDAPGTHSGVVKGKYGYMSPELIKGEPMDRRADIYALGTVLFEALAGERPFVGGPNDVLNAILKEPVPLLTAFREGLPSDLVALTEAMLAKSPRDRPQTMREVELSLAEIARREGWGSSEVAKVVRILGGGAPESQPPSVMSRPPPSRPPPPPPPSPPTRQARGKPGPAEQPSAERETLADFLGVETAIEEQPSVEPLPGRGSLDLNGRLSGRPSDRLVSGELLTGAPPTRAKRLPSGVVSSPAPSRPPSLELEFDRTELAAMPNRTPESIPPLPEIHLGSNLLPVILRVLVVLGLAVGATAALRYWRAQQGGPGLIKLTVESRPSGAEVWVDGLPTGKYTTAVLDWDNQIKHVLLLKQEGRANAFQEIPAGQPAGVVAVELLAVSRVRVSTQPEGARVSSANEVLGTTPCTVNVLTDTATKLTVSLEGYLDQATTVTVASGDLFDWSPALVAAGQLEVVSDPADAQVQIDGAVVGRTPVKVSVAAASPHAVVVEAKDIEPYRVTVGVAPGKSRRVFARLTDKEERRLQAALKQANRELDELGRQYQLLQSTQSSEYFAAMANLKKRTAIEAKIDKLTRRRDDLESQIDARRSELEDRAAKAAVAP